MNTASAAAINLLVHVGGYSPVRCPACRKTSWMNVYSSVKDPITWPPQDKQQQPATEPEPQLSEEELEKKRIDESKYEKP